MTNSLRFMVLALAWVVLTGADAVSPAEKTSVMIRANDVAARSEQDPTIGQYYTIQYALPEKLTGQQVERAILELYVDVRAKAREDYVNQAPTLEVYAPTEALTGGVEIESLDGETRAGRPVALGEGRLVRIDVTKIIRAHLSGALENDGLVIGSLSGMREGDFTVIENRFPDGAAARLNIYARDQVK